jgi:hypothetical protein
MPHPHPLPVPALGDVLADPGPLPEDVTEPPAAAGRPARVELMGYRQHIGRVREVTLAGAPMLALSAMDGPEIVFPASAVYCITWLPEAALEAPPPRPALGAACTCERNSVNDRTGEDPRCPVHGCGCGPAETCQDCADPENPF